MSRLLKQIAPHNSAPGAVVSPCLVCGTTNDVGTTDCCPAALCTPCLRKAAKTQGALFRCPLCRDDGAFVVAAKRRGVVANAKDTPKYASGEDLSVRRRCNASRCKAPGGRFVDAAENPLTRHGNTSQWALATCASCGQTSRHHGCVRRFEGFRCEDCDVQVLERVADDFRKWDRVEARFSGGPRWYGAKVVAVGDRYRVNYDDDGSFELISNAARIRHRVDAEERPPPRTTEGGSGSQRAGRSRRDEDDEDDEGDDGDDGAALRALRERVKGESGVSMTAARNDALLAGWTGSRLRNPSRGSATTGTRRRNGYAYSFVAPDGAEITTITRAAAAVLVTAAVGSGDDDQVIEGGISCEVRRVGSTEWRRFGSFTRAGRTLGLRPGCSNYLSRLANDDPKLPAWVREKFEARRVANDDEAAAVPVAGELPAEDDEAAEAAVAEPPAPAAPALATNNPPALRALIERLARDIGDVAAAALIAGWRGSRRRGSVGYLYKFEAPDGGEFTTIGAAAAAAHAAAALRTLRDRVLHARGSMTTESLDGMLAGWSGSRQPKAERGRKNYDYSFVGPGGARFRSIASAAAAILGATAAPAASEVHPRPRPGGLRAAPLTKQHDDLGYEPRAKRSNHGPAADDKTAAAELAPPAAPTPPASKESDPEGAAHELSSHLRLGEDPAPADASEVAEPDATASLRVEAERSRAENDALWDDLAATARREARLRAEAELSILQVDNRMPAAARVERPERETAAAATKQVAAARTPATAPTGAPNGYLNHRFVDEPAPGEDSAVEERVIVALWFDSDLRVVTADIGGPIDAQGAWMAETRLLGAAADARTVTYHTGSSMTQMMARYRELHPDYAPATGPIIYVPPAPAVPTWPAPAERSLPPPPPPPPPPLLGHAGASLAANDAFRAASAAALRNLREALGAVETLATSEFQGPMKRPVARLALKVQQLTNHVAASEVQLVERTVTTVAAAAAVRPPRWTPEEDELLLRRVGDERSAGRARPGIWDRVAAAFPSRTASAAEGRWKDLAARDPNRKRQRERHSSGPRWSPDEETRLRQVVEDERKAIAGGAPKASVWGRVAVALGTGRTGGAVSQHWSAMMNRDGTGTTAARWTSDEEQRLTRLVEAERATGGKCIRGSFWDGAAEALGTKRTAAAVNSHWQTMNSPRPRKKARTDEPEPPPDTDADDPFGLRAGLAALFSWAPGGFL